MIEIKPELERLKQLWQSIQEDKQQLDGLQEYQQKQNQDIILQTQIDRLTQVTVMNDNRIKNMNTNYEQNKGVQIEYQTRLGSEEQQTRLNQQVWDQKQNTYITEIQDKNEQMEQLNQQIEQQQVNMAKYNVDQFNNTQFKYDHITQTQHKSTKLKQLQIELDKYKLQMDQIQSKVKNTHFQEIQIKQIKEDKNKLIDILRRTTEFQQIYQVEDCYYLDKFNTKVCEQADQIIDQEKQYWIPEQAQQFMNKFRMEYKGQLNNNLVDSLLYELNSIWKNKEQKSLKVMKQNYQSQINHLKKQLSSKQQLSQQQLAKEVDRLETQLKWIYRENREQQRQQQQSDDNGYIQQMIKMNKDNHKSHKEMERMQNQRKRDIQRAVSKCEGNTTKAFKKGIDYILDDLQKMSDQIESTDIQKMLKDNINHYRNII